MSKLKKHFMVKQSVVVTKEKPADFSGRWPFGFNSKMEGRKGRVGTIVRVGDYNQEFESFSYCVKFDDNFDALYPHQHLKA